MDFVGLEDLWRKKLINEKWSTEAAALYQNFLASSTLRTYNSYLRQYTTFVCSQYQRFPPLNDDIVPSIVDFMLDKSKSSNRPESILRCVTASLQHFYLAYKNINPINNDIINFAKALIKSETKVPTTRTNVMPVDAFTRLFNSWQSNEQLPLNKLRQKAVTLVALAFMTRPSDLAPKAGFRRNQIKQNPNGNITVTFFGIKNDYNKRGFEVTLARGSNPKLCPVKCLLHYMERTAHLTVEDGPVFLTLAPPISAVNSSTVASILRTSIKDAGLPPTFTPKCFRASAATAAVASGTQLLTVQQIGRWRSDEVIKSHYLYPYATTEEYTDKLFQSSIKPKD